MIDILKKLAWEAGEICLRQSARLTAADMDFKSTRDLVTVVDRQVEDFLVDAIAGQFPQHSIIGEETGVTTKDGEHCWIIDPIDGTTSYFHGQPFYAVSIAYQQGGRTSAGVVYAPALGQMFTAVRGQGAWLNGVRIKVSETSEMINAVFATGFACLRAGRQPNNLYYLGKVLPHIRDFRRCGSAAIDLAYVAAGKVDGFWEMDLNIYDIAAGALLVEEAGGRVADMRGEDAYPESGIVATNGRVMGALLALLNG